MCVPVTSPTPTSSRCLGERCMSVNGAMALQARLSVKASSGQRQMLSLSSPLASPPAEDLNTSQVRSTRAHRARSRKYAWQLAAWNVRTLLDSEGSVRTARQGRDAGQAEDRRVDLVVRELKRYSVKVVTLQETLFFGNEVYNVGDSVVLTAGRPPPPALGESVKSGQGVAIVLLGPAAWRAAGEQWKAQSSRLVSTKLKTGNRTVDQLHVLSCYTPTQAASREKKNEFFRDLEQALSEIPADEPYVCTTWGSKCPCWFKNH